MLNQQSKEYFLQRYEMLKPLVLDTIKLHRAELDAVIGKITNEMGDQLIGISGEPPEGFDDIETTDISVEPAELRDLRRALIGVYVAGFVFEQLTNAEDLDFYAEQAWSGGRHDGRALRIGRSLPRH